MIKYKKNISIDVGFPNEIAHLVSKNESNVLILKDGNVVYSTLSDDFHDVYIKSFDEALKEKENILNRYKDLMKSKEVSIKTNYETTNSGLFIHVPKNKIIEDKITVFYIQDNFDFVHNTIIILEQGSQLNYFEYMHNNKTCSVNYISNTILEDNASLKYTTLTRYCENSTVMSFKRAYIKRDASAKYYIGELNDSRTISENEFKLLNEGASATCKVVALTDSVQDVKINSTIEHLAPYTEGYLNNYGVANNNSVLIFNGIGKINNKMKRSIARQSNKGIVLGETSRLDANPLLLIDEYDVEASHGAAIGKIDDEQLYYLMSRGLSESEAKKLIINGFLAPVLSELPSEELKIDFMKSVNKKTQ